MSASGILLVAVGHLWFTFHARPVDRWLPSLRFRSAKVAA